jgi:hypothetical protein
MLKAYLIPYNKIFVTLFIKLSVIHVRLMLTASYIYAILTAIF